MTTTSNVLLLAVGVVVYIALTILLDLHLAGRRSRPATATTDPEPRRAE